MTESLGNQWVWVCFWPRPSITATLFSISNFPKIFQQPQTLERFPSAQLKAIRQQCVKGFGGGKSTSSYQILPQPLAQIHCNVVLCMAKGYTGNTHWISQTKDRDLWGIFTPYAQIHMVKICPTFTHLLLGIPAKYYASGTLPDEKFSFDSVGWGVIKVLLKCR